jgi:chromosome segregation ATPase
MLWKLSWGITRSKQLKPLLLKKIIRLNNDEAARKIKILEEQHGEAQKKVEHSLAEKETLSLENSSLNVELEEHQKKLNELQVALAVVVAEKEAASEEIHSLRKTLEGMSQCKELEIQVIKLLFINCYSCVLPVASNSVAIPIIAVS